MSVDQVQRELGLVENQIEVADRIISTAKEETRELLLRARDKNAKVARGELLALAIARKRVADDAIEEILLPEQLVRLRQIAFRIEVSHMGLANALTYGRLGEEVEIYENQVDSILVKGRDVTQRVTEEINAILKEAEDEILELLAPEQRKKAEDALGPFFQYKDDTVLREIREKTAESEDKK